LKIRRGIVLDYPDGKLHRQDLYRVVCDLTLLMRQFRPQVTLTFGSEGGVTAHTDHSMAGIFATLAFQWAGRSNRYPDQIREHTSPHRTQSYITQPQISHCQAGNLLLSACDRCD